MAPSPQEEQPRRSESRPPPTRRDGPPGTLSEKGIPAGGHAQARGACQRQATSRPGRHGTQSPARRAELGPGTGANRDSTERASPAPSRE